MEFEWDEAKRVSNLEKHGLDFQDVDLLFRGKVAIAPASSSRGEERFLAIGQVAGRHVTVVYTVRGGVYRIISFRRARHDEKTRYQALYG